MLIHTAPTACVRVMHLLTLHSIMPLLLLPPYPQHKFATRIQEHLQGPGLRAQ
jgi:hypothetical protein